MYLADVYRRDESDKLVGLDAQVLLKFFEQVEYNGRRLAKRDGAAELAALRRAGIDGRALAEKLRAGQLPAGYSWVSD